MGEEMSPGDNPAVATWYRSGWKTWWLRRSTSRTSTGASFRARAALRPPKPPPTMTTLGRRSVTYARLRRQRTAGHRGAKAEDADHGHCDEHDDPRDDADDDRLDGVVVVQRLPHRNDQCDERPDPDDEPEEPAQESG